MPHALHLHNSQWSCLSSALQKDSQSSKLVSPSAVDSHVLTRLTPPPSTTALVADEGAHHSHPWHCHDEVHKRMSE